MNHSLYLKVIEHHKTMGLTHALTDDELDIANQIKKLLPSIDLHSHSKNQMNQETFVSSSVSILLYLLNLIESGLLNSLTH